MLSCLYIYHFLSTKSLSSPTLSLGSISLILSLPNLFSSHPSVLCCTNIYHRRELRNLLVAAKNHQDIITDIGNRVFEGACLRARRTFEGVCLRARRKFEGACLRTHVCVFHYFLLIFGLFIFYTGKVKFDNSFSFDKHTLRY